VHRIRDRHAVRQRVAVVVGFDADRRTEADVREYSRESMSRTRNAHSSLIPRIALLGTFAFASFARASAADVVIDDSHSSYTTSSPSPYVRIFARNHDSTAHDVRIEGIDLIHREGPTALVIDRVFLEGGSPRPLPRNLLRVSAGDEPLVVIWFHDPLHAFETMRGDFMCRVHVTVDGEARTLDVRVNQAIREPIRRR
jgi:hypothetical protein